MESSYLVFSCLVFSSYPSCLLLDLVDLDLLHSPFSGVRSNLSLSNGIHSIPLPPIQKVECVDAYRRKTSS